MKNDLTHLTSEIEKKVGKKIPVGADFEKLASFFAIKHHIKLNADALHKVWNYVSGKEKPTKKTLNKLALLWGIRVGMISMRLCMEMMTEISITKWRKRRNRIPPTMMIFKSECYRRKTFAGMDIEKGDSTMCIVSLLYLVCSA